MTMVALRRSATMRWQAKTSTSPLVAVRISPNRVAAFSNWNGRVAYCATMGETSLVASLGQIVKFALDLGVPPLTGLRDIGGYLEGGAQHRMR